MIINLGYVAISMELKDCSPNRTVTLKGLKKLNKSQWEKKLYAVASENLGNTVRILRYNKAYGIKLYRLTSKLVPLCTHEELREWEWQEQLREDFKRVGDCVRETGIRISTHPDHFTLLNSPRKEVTESSIRDLDYHCTMYELMGLGREYKMVLHIGGVYSSKDDSIKRFCNNFLALDDRIRNRIILENDDKLYNAAEVLDICRTVGAPMVLDIHHDRCNPSKYNVSDLIGDIFETWVGEPYPPKIHLSSPKSDKDQRSHHDYIEPEFFAGFLEKIKDKVGDFDVMVEAKMKDRAVFKLMDDLKAYPGITRCGDASICL
jgi:UV DNA damage endonuclease